MDHQYIDDTIDTVIYYEANWVQINRCHGLMRKDVCSTCFYCIDWDMWLFSLLFYRIDNLTMGELLRHNWLYLGICDNVIF